MQIKIIVFYRKIKLPSRSFFNSKQNPMKHFKLLFALVVFSAIGASAQTTIYSQNFSGAGLPAGWQNIDNATGGKWARKTSAHSFASSTASNGFYIFDSDAAGNDNKAEDADLITATINCSANNFVALQFEQYFQQYATSEGTVSVSTDGTTWTSVYTVNKTTANPEIVTINITNIAANQATVYLKFNYIGNYDYWWAIDDIKLFEPPAYDISVETVNIPRYSGLKDQVISGTIKNKGYMPLTSVDLSYTVNGSAAINQPITGIYVAPFDNYNFSFTQKLQMQTPLVYEVTVNALSPSGATDVNLGDNTTTKNVIALSALPEKNVLVEQFTTAPCQFCPDGAVVMKDIFTTLSYAVPVALHAGFSTDAMTTTEASAQAGAYISGAPSAAIDRVLFDGEEEIGTNRGAWKNYTIARYGQLSPATVSATSIYDVTSRELNVTVTAKFFGPITGDFRLNAYLVEDSVTGTGNGYNQVNAYNNSAGHPYQGQGNPIVGYVHRNVERKALGGNWGTSGVIPSTTTNGGEYTQSYTYTIPAGFNVDRCRVVAFAHEYSNNYKSGKNEVLNAVSVPLNGTRTQNATPSVYTDIKSPESVVTRLSVYPNPANDVVYLDYAMKGDASTSFEIFDMMGKLVANIPSMEQSAGNYTMSVATDSFANGVYFVVAKNNNQTAGSIKFVINR